MDVGVDFEWYYCRCGSSIRIFIVIDCIVFMFEFFRRLWIYGEDCFCYGLIFLEIWVFRKIFYFYVDCYGMWCIRGYGYLYDWKWVRLLFDDYGYDIYVLFCKVVDYCFSSRGFFFLLILGSFFCLFFWDDCNYFFWN